MSAETGITIKYGKGYDETWATFKGDLPPIRESLIDYFGIDRDFAEGLTLSELVVNATQIAHGKGNTLAALGGVVIPSSPAAAVTPTPTAEPSGDEAQQASGGDPWEGVTPRTDAAPAAPAANPLLARIKASTDVTALQRLYAENAAAFSDETLLNAWKAKGKSLTA